MPAGNWSNTVTPVAASGPSLETVTTKLTLCPTFGVESSTIFVSDRFADVVAKGTVEVSAADVLAFDAPSGDGRRGAKGILVLEKDLPARSIVLRDSMVKYKCEHNSAARYLDILDWNKYKAGFLNRQIIILLKSLGIRDEIFMKRQSQHIERISNLTFKDCSIFKHMNDELNTDINNLEPANVTILHLLRAGFKLEDEPFFRGVLETMKKNGYHQLKVKSNMVIEKSARIIGVGHCTCRSLTSGTSWSRGSFTAV